MASKEWNLVKRKTHIDYGMNKSSFKHSTVLLHKQAENRLPHRVHHTVHFPNKSSPFHGQPGPTPLPWARGVSLGGLAAGTSSLTGHLMPWSRQSCHRTQVADTSGVFHNATIIHKQHPSEFISQSASLKLSFLQWPHCIYAWYLCKEQQTDLPLMYIWKEFLLWELNAT